MDEPVQLTLYVADKDALKITQRLIKARRQAKAGVSDLRIVDVSLHPELMNSEHLLDVPCLKVTRGAQEFVLMGDVSDLELIGNALRNARHH